MCVSACTLPSLVRQDNLDPEYRLIHGNIFIPSLNTRFWETSKKSTNRNLVQWPGTVFCLFILTFQSTLSSVYFFSKDLLKKTMHLLFSYDVEKRYGQSPVFWTASCVLVKDQKLLSENVSQQNNLVKILKYCGKFGFIIFWRHFMTVYYVLCDEVVHGPSPLRPLVQQRDKSADKWL